MTSSDLVHYEDLTDDQMLLCCICKKLLDNPMQLQCLHNCCKHCLDVGTADDAGSFITCPACCHLTHTATASSNPLLSVKVTHFKAFVDARMCGLCSNSGSTTVAATVWCKACGKSFCADCMLWHSTCNKDHVTLEEVPWCSKSVAVPTLSCSQHRKAYEFVCLTCETTKCIDCWATCNKLKHDMILANDDSMVARATKVKEELAGLERDLQTKAGLLRKHLSLTDELKAARAEHLNEVRRKKKVIMNAVDDACIAAEEAIKDLYDALDEKALEIKAAAMQLDKRVHQAVDYCHYVVDSGLACALLHQQKQLLSQLTSLVKEVETVESPVNAAAAVVINGSMPADLEQQVSAWIGTPTLAGDDLSCDTEELETLSTAAATCHSENGSNAKIVKALYDWEAGTAEDLTFAKGDMLQILNDEDKDWWYAQHLGNSTKGYIPQNYVAIENTLENFEWFFANITRKDADKYLQTPGYPTGTFIIRKTERGSYVLCIRDVKVDGLPTVRHYLIGNKEDGCFYVSTRRAFKNLEELVSYHKTAADGLCCKLVKACPQEKLKTWGLSHETREQWEIPRESITLVEKLYDGIFGEEWKAKWNNSTDVAVKVLKQGTMSTQAFLDVAAIMKHCRHQKVVQHFAVCSQEEPFYVITELMPHGSLLTYLRRPPKDIKLEVMVDMAAQIASGMAFLEREHIIHRDLAARNVLVGYNNEVKVGDFVMAKLTGDGTYEAPQGSKFPIKWTAPEAAFDGHFSIKSDVWSYGILLVEIVTHGQVPYPGIKNREVLDKLKTGYRIPCPAGCHTSVYEIMLMCWKQSPEQRPTFDYLYEYFDDFFIVTEPTHKEIVNCA